MFYERELQFLCDTFKKCRISATVLSPEDKVLDTIDKTLEPIMDIFPLASMSIKDVVGHLDPYTVYKYTDEFQICYILMVLPETPHENILFIGPYVSSELSPRQTLEIGEKKGISPKNQKLLDEYYLTLPIIPDGSHLFLMLDAFCERIWGTSSYAIVDSSKENLSPASPLSDLGDSSNFDDITVNMAAMEKRYNYENEIMQAVSLGHIHKLNNLFASFSPDAFQMRVADPLRNAKNYCIIMNTLLRKAAQAGGVHPVYLNSVSSAFAIKTEQLTSYEECSNHMKEIFRSYCRLVRKHSMKDFSPLVQKTIILIDSDLSANLSLSTLAENQKVSPGYLSTIFKKETGKTVTEFIREKRMKHAAYLLSTTHLQIQTIALHCGIMDVQYFSKIFKKHTGKTPKEYREFMKQSAN